MEIRKVGVVGCGMMGSGITIVCAQAGYPTIVSEVNDDLLRKGLDSIDVFLSNSVEKGKISQQDKDATVNRIKGTTDMKDFHDCDLVIEAAVENLDLKKRIFANLDQVCPERTILATNTSSLSVIDISTATKRPDKILGLHFFNPPQIMKLLEIVKTIAVSDETMETCRQFGNSIGKTIVIVKDTPAFVVNALLVPYLLNAIRMFDAGIATKEDIDTAAKAGLNYPMGPLTLSDHVGLDTLLFLSDAVYEQLKDPQWVAPTILRKMVTAGWYGRKSGKGFYDY